MEAFAHLFAPHFPDPTRSLADTFGGFVDHATRFNSGLPGTGPLAALFKTANTQTQALSLRAQQAQQGLGLSLGTQKQATGDTATGQATALERIRKNEATLRGDALIEDEKERQRLYDLLYPTGGLMYYTDARLGTELADRLNEYLTRTEAEKTALGDVFVTRTQAALGPFRQTRETQVAALATTGTARDERSLLVDELNEQCDANYHLLSLFFRQELTRPAAFWNPSFYFRAAAAVPAGQLRHFTVKAHQHRVLFELPKFAAATALALTLPAGGPFFLGRGATATAPRPAAVLEVLPGPAPQALLLAAVPGTEPFLLGYNEGGTAVVLEAALS